VIPNATADTSTLVKVASIAYPLGDILVWAMLVRLWMTDSRSRPVMWLAVGALGLIASDVAYGISQFYGDWGNGTIIDLGWILFYASWGAAALDPSMKELDKVVVKRTPVRISRLAALAATALIAPLVLLVESFRGNAADVAVTVAVFSAVLFVLVILRMYTLVHTISRREADVVIERQKNEVYATIAHQLKAPATRVKVVLSMLGTGAFGDMPDKQRGYIEKASKANEELLTIIEETLIIARAETGLLKVPPAVVNVRELIDTALGEQAGQIEAKRLVVEKDFPNSDCLIQVNLKHLSMAVTNLLENAIKYTPTEGKVTIQARRRPNSVALSITDTGEGIASEELPKIFDRFYRSPEQIELTEGTGIGLYLVKQVVALNGGKVSVRSRKGHGATFTMELPAADVTVQAAPSAKPQGHTL
jgi:signal transduction histidine kinase